MHNTVYNNPVHLVHIKDGVVRTFKSKDDVVRRWAEIRRLDIGARFKIEYEWLKEITLRVRETHQGILYARYHDYVLRDSFGDILDPEDIKEAYRKVKPYRYSWRGYPNERMPGSKRNNYHWFRRPKTTNEKRQAYAWLDDEDAPIVRGRRNPKHLPDAWDDRTRTDYDARSWKNFRKTQWK